MKMNVEFLKDIRHRYFLAQHIYYCTIDDNFIVFDLRKNKYLFLDESEKYVFRTLFENEDVFGAKGSHDLNLSIKALVERELLVDGPKKGRQDITVNLIPATQDMNGYPFDGIPKIKPGHIYQCFKAFLYTKLLLRFNSMERVIGKIKRRKNRQLAKNLPEVNLEKTRDLVEIFRILNVLFYSSWDKGLFDSLVLVNFLASYGIYPNVVCGVKMGPFGAHAWVQDGPVSYNCAVLHAEIFKPIMIA